MATVHQLPGAAAAPVIQRLSKGRHRKDVASLPMFRKERGVQQMREREAKDAQINTAVAAAVGLSADGQFLFAVKMATIQKLESVITELRSDIALLTNQR